MSCLSRPSRSLLFGVITFGVFTVLLGVRDVPGTTASVLSEGGEPYLLAQSDEAEMRYRAAQGLYEQEQYAEAMRILEEAAERFPEDGRIASLQGKVRRAMEKQKAEEAGRREREEKARREEISAHLRNGERALKGGEFARARAAYQAVLSLDAQNEVAKAGLTDVAQAEREEMETRAAEARKEAAEQAAGLAEEQRKGMIRTAERLARGKDYAGAIEVLEQAQAQFPDDREIAKSLERYRERDLDAKIEQHVAQADALRKEKEYEKALSEFQAALALDPENRGLKGRIARVEREIERAEEEREAARREAAEKASQLAKEQREETIRTAEQLARDDNYADAIALLEKAQAESPDDPELAKDLERYRGKQAELEVEQRVARAKALWREGKNEEALTELRAALVLDPGNRDLRRNIALVEREMGAEAERREEEPETEDVVGRKVAEHLSEAREMIDQGDLEKALRVINEARSLQPDNEEVAQLETEVRAKLQEASEKASEEEAKPEEERLREQRQERLQREVEALLGKAEGLIERGEYDDARKQLAKVRELQPNNQIAVRLEREARLKEQEKEAQAEREKRADRLEQKRKEAAELVDAARRALKKDEYSEAMRLAKEANQLDPQNGDATAVAREAAAKKAQAEQKVEIDRVKVEIDRRLAEARTYVDRGDHDNAIEICKQVLLIDDGNQDAMKLREQAEEGKRGADAQAQQREAQGYYERAQVFYEQGEWDAAEEELEHALEAYPGHADSKRLLSKLSEARNREAKRLAEQQKKKEEEEQKLRAMSAQEAFERGEALYEEGDIIGAWEAWERAVQIDPSFATPRVFMERTEADYQKALAIREEDEQKRAEDIRWEAKLDAKIASFEIPEPEDIETVLTSILGVLSGFNFIVGEGVTGKIEVRIQGKTLREILDLLLLPNGFAWTREKDTILVRTKFRSRVFPLTPEEYKRVKQILEHPESLEDPELDLRQIIYGERAPEEVPGRELRLNVQTQTLIVRDSETNIAKVESWLTQLEDIVLAREPYIYRSVVLDPEIATTVYELVKRFLVEERSGDEVTHRQEGKRIIFDESSGTLVILDTPQNIQHVEEIILREDILSKLKRGVLKARVFRITDDTGMDPEAVFRRLEVIRGVVSILKTMLYEGTGETEEEANARGRRIFYPESRDQELRDPRFIGTITVVDTEDNLRKVQEFLGSAGGVGTRNFYVIRVQHRDITDLKRQLDRVTGRVRDRDVGVGGLGYDVTRQLQVRALIVDDPQTHSLIIRADDPGIMDEIETVVELLDQPVDQVEIETRLIEVSLDDIRSVGLDWSLTQIGEHGLLWSDNINKADVTVDPTSLTATFRTLGETQLDAALTLISTLDTAEVLSAPKITVLSSPPEPAMISVDTIEPYVESVDLDTKGDDDPRNDTLRPNFADEPIGISLEVTPTVLPDGYVELDLSPVVSTVVGRVPVVVTGGEAGALGSASLEGLGRLRIDESSATTRIRVKDGDTVVIGGLIRDQLVRTLNAVPILGHIPIIKYLFRDTADTITKETLLIFVTVHVIKSE